MRLTLLELQNPLCNALSIASMEGSTDITLTVAHTQALDRWLATLLKVTDKAEHSLEFCPLAVLLPPFPTMGLA